MRWVLGWLLLASPAYALRPFQGTDADVTSFGQFELELGPASLRFEQGDRIWLVPRAAFNFGVWHRLELVLEGAHAVGNGIVDDDVTAKVILRKGCLQDASGPSIALETAVLLPELGRDGERGVGGTEDLIVSFGFPSWTVHANATAGVSRSLQPITLADVIVEAPADWAVRPAIELVGGTDGQPAGSALAGLLWPIAENFQLDAGVLVARDDGVTGVEARVGLTWSLSLKGLIPHLRGGRFHLRFGRSGAK